MLGVGSRKSMLEPPYNLYKTYFVRPFPLKKTKSNTPVLYYCYNYYSNVHIFGTLGKSCGCVMFESITNYYFHLLNGFFFFITCYYNLRSLYASLFFL